MPQPSKQKLKHWSKNGAFVGAGLAIVVEIGFALMGSPFASSNAARAVGSLIGYSIWGALIGGAAATIHSWIFER